MMIRFAIGEVRSNFFFSNDEAFRAETLGLLTSGDVLREDQGLRRHQESRGRFLESLPRDTRWHLAMLRTNRVEFDQLRTINDAAWLRYSRGTRRLVDAAAFLAGDERRDPRVSTISKQFPGNVELRGITLLGKDPEGTSVIVEGTARLVAVCQRCLAGSGPGGCPDELEVVLGLTASKWQWD
jgi:hypothetical protein